MFLVAHFHHVIVGGVVFALFAGSTYWFPKAFGFRLHEGLGKAIFWCWFIGFHLAFMPLYILGFFGATRRMQHIPDPTWAPYLNVALLGAVVIGVGIALTVVQLLYSIKTREQRLDVTGDPWDGRTLEWLTLSPPPHYNFAVLPDVHGEEAYWTRKQTAIKQDALIDEPDYQPIEMPIDTPTGVICAFFTSVCGFAIIWHIWWLAIIGLIGAFAVGGCVRWRDEHRAHHPRRGSPGECARTPPHPDGAPPQSEPIHVSSSETAAIGLTHVGSEDTGLGHRGPESKSIVVPYGFWLFVLSDMVLFSALFATYAALSQATDGGPTSNQIFDRNLVAVETIALLISSFTCGLAIIAAKRRT